MCCYQLPAAAVRISQSIGENDVTTEPFENQLYILQVSIEINRLGLCKHQRVWYCGSCRGCDLKKIIL